ncbi:MAG: ferritin family protein [Acidobacteria bacterium]|nr:ferritin family protein [Acidobacteriota bacterium]
MAIDFSRLSLKDALDLAVLIEQEAEERYLEFADQMTAHHTPEAEKFFRFMAVNEQKHGSELAARRAELFGDASSAVSPTMILDVEAPEYDQARAFMSPRAALTTALRSEEKAYSYFDRALPSITNADVRALFEELRDDEIHHIELVKAELAKLPPGEEPNPDNFVDEPTAQ